MAFLQINEVWSGILTISKFRTEFSQFEDFEVAFSQFFHFFLKICRSQALRFHISDKIGVDFGIVEMKRCN